MTDPRETLLDEMFALTGDASMREDAAECTEDELRVVVERLRRDIAGIRQYGRLGYMARLDGEQGWPRVERK